MRLSSNCISSRSLRSRAPSGSSSSSTDGRFASARASATRCCLTARELAWVALAVALEPHRRQRLLHALLDLFAGELLALRAERHVLRDGHVREQRVGLEHHVRVAFVGRQARGVRTVHQDPALGRGLEAGEHPQRRRLAAPARPQQREELPASHVEADAVDGDDLAEALHDVVEGQCDAVAGAVLHNGRIPSACSVSVLTCSSS